MQAVHRYTFHVAAKYSIIEILVKANKFDLNTRDDNGRTPIHYAAQRGHLEALKLILSMGYVEENFN
jgi:ankyrin repeat protein